MSNSQTNRRRRSPPKLSAVDRTAARYLYAITLRSNGSEHRVTTGALTEELDVTAASVTEMLGKLEDRGFLEYEKYQGVRLTPRGETIANRVARRVCLVTGFFETELDAGLEEQTAFEIGVVLPKEGVVRLRELVATPCLDPCPESGRPVDPCVG